MKYEMYAFKKFMFLLWYLYSMYNAQLFMFIKCTHRT